MSQPDWECVAQIGDASPLEYGGLWIFVDKTGVYPPEVELLMAPDEDDDAGRNIRTVYRFILEPCTYINGILSDNKFHPDHPAWFAKPESERAKRPQDSTYLKNVADFIGRTVDELAADFCGDDLIAKARAWEAVGSYHGFLNLDQYPLELRRRETRKRYSDPRYKVKTPA